MSPGFFYALKTIRGKSLPGPPFSFLLFRFFFPVRPSIWSFVGVKLLYVKGKIKKAQTSPMWYTVDMQQQRYQEGLCHGYC
ncbi:MAG: hypothetical protein IJU20_00965, partial [Clostridia bacterium]|nr:hypothetical protein [Clostridia bacterium]